MNTEQQAPELKIKDRYQIENEIEDGDFTMMWATLSNVQAREAWFNSERKRCESIWFENYREKCDEVNRLTTRIKELENKIRIVSKEFEECSYLQHEQRYKVSMRIEGLLK